MTYNPDIECPRCKKVFTPKNRVQIYCSYACKKAVALARRQAEWKAEGKLEAEVRAALKQF